MGLDNRTPEERRLVDALNLMRSRNNPEVPDFRVELDPSDATRVIITFTHPPAPMDYINVTFDLPNERFHERT